MRKHKMKRVLLSVFLSAMLMLSGAFQALASDLTPDQKAEPEVSTVPIEEIVEVEKQEEVLPAPVETAEEPKPEASVIPEAAVEAPKNAVLDVAVPEALVEEPKAEEPKAEESKAEEPKAEEPKVEETQKLAVQGMGLIDWNKHLKKVDCKPGKGFDWDFDWDFDIDLDCDIDLDFDWGGFPDLDCDHIPEANIVRLDFEKKWHDEKTFFKKVVIMELYADGKKVAYFPLTWHSVKPWKLHFYAPKGIHGKDFVYTVKEKEIKGYETEIIKDGNKFTIHNYRLGKLHIMKEWVGDEERVDFRPEEISYQLLKNGVLLPEIHKLTKSNDWEDALTLPMYDNDGAVSYEVKEFSIEGYDTSYAYDTMGGRSKCCPDKDKYHHSIYIKNCWTNKKEIDLEKIWELGEGKEIPNLVKFVLYQDDVKIETLDITKAMDWKKTIEVPIFDNVNHRYVYRVEEMALDERYESSVDGFTITNTWKDEEPQPEMITIKGEKTWLDDGTGRPAMIKVKLMVGEVVLETMEVKPVDGKWLYEFKKEYPKFDDSDKEIKYWVSEEAVPGYMLISHDAYNLVNLRVGKVTINGEKTWDDLMLRPAMITVKLLQNGKDFMEKEVKPGEDGKWFYEFKDLAQFDDKGMPYLYTVGEVKISGYDVKVEGYNLKNYQKRATLILKKVNEDKVGLPGAVFAVYDLKGKLIKTLTTEADGTFKIDLPLGMYRVNEVTAPKGYDKQDFSRLVILAKDGEKVNVEIVNKKSKNGFTPLPDTGGGSSTGGGGYYPTLPKTGSVNQPILYVLGLFSLFVGASELLRKKRVS